MTNRYIYLYSFHDHLLFSNYERIFMGELMCVYDSENAVYPKHLHVSYSQHLMSEYDRKVKTILR